MRLSVIIPCYNQDDLIIRHVTACAKSTQLPAEVVVVNDGGGRDLRDKLPTELWPFPVVYLRVARDIPWHQPGARNAGWVASTGTMLSFEDADHFPGETYYKLATYALRDSGVAMVGADRRMMVTGETLHAAPGIMVVRRADMVAAGGYDEDFSGHYGCDDILIRERLSAFGKAITLPANMYVDAFGGTPDLVRDVRHNRKLLQEKVHEPATSAGLMRFAVSCERL